MELRLRLRQMGPSLTEVTIGQTDFYFSYETCVAVRPKDGGFVVSENIWSNTTGKHLSQLQPDKSKRAHYMDFQKALQAAIANP